MNLADEDKTRVQLDAVAQFFKKMRQRCFADCVNLSYSQLELHVGEFVCADRCLRRYLQAHSIVQNVFTEVTGDKLAEPAHISQEATKL